MIDLERQAEQFGKIEEAGGLRWIVETYGSGVSLKHIAADACVPRYWLWVYLHDEDHPDRLKAFRLARKPAASAMVDAMLERADDLGGDGAFIDGPRVQAAKLQVETMKWVAGKTDPDMYGEKQATPGMVLNVGELHLRAVREFVPPPMIAPTPKQEDIVDADLEGE